MLRWAMRSSEGERNEQACGFEVTLITNRLLSVRGTASTPSGRGAVSRLCAAGHMLPMRSEKTVVRPEGKPDHLAAAQLAQRSCGLAVDDLLVARQYTAMVLVSGPSISRYSM